MFNLQQKLLKNANSAGKAMPLNTLVKTPGEWTRLGDLKIGDSVIGPKGNIAAVTNLYSQGVTECFRFVFEDGRTADSHPLHLWDVSELPLGVEGAVAGPSYVTTTQDIINHFEQFAYHIPLVGEISGKGAPASGQKEIEDITHCLLAGGVHIDDTVIELAYVDRYAIVKAMLLRSGCHVCDRGVALTTSAELAAANFQKLVWSIGGIANKCQYNNIHKVCFKHRDMEGLVDSFMGDKLVNVLNLDGYQNLKLKLVGIHTQQPVETLCISINSEDALYIVNDWVVTHNTFLKPW